MPVKEEVVVVPSVVTRIGDSNRTTCTPGPRTGPDRRVPVADLISGLSNDGIGNSSCRRLRSRAVVIVVATVVAVVDNEVLISLLILSTITSILSAKMARMCCVTSSSIF